MNMKSVRPIITWPRFFKIRRTVQNSSNLNLLNPYLLHFGNIQERHFWKKNPNFIFWSLMTSYMTNNLWRHVIPKLHQLVQLYITWHKSRDIISVRYHEMKVITPKKPGTSGSVIFGKKIQTILGTSGSVISGKIIQKWLFRVIWLEKNSFLNYRILGTELASFLEKKSRRLFLFRTPTR